MKLCRICGASNPDDGVVCVQCGASLAPVLEIQGGMLCSVCGYRNPPAMIFCQECGARLPFEATQEEIGSSREEPHQTPTAEQDWVAMLEGFFPEIPSEEQPSPLETIPPGTEARVTPPASVGEVKPPVSEAPLYWEWAEEEKSVPSTPEPAPQTPMEEQSPLPFELWPSTQEAPATPLEGVLPEIAESWLGMESIEEKEKQEELGTFPFSAYEPLFPGQGEEAPLFSEGEERPLFPPLKGLGEEPQQTPEASLFAGEPETTPLFQIQEVESSGWKWDLEEAVKLSEETISESLYEPFQTRGSEESPLVAPEISTKEPLIQTGPFVIEEMRPPEAPSASAQAFPFTDLEAVLAEMPEWLQTLRPVPEEEERAPSEAVPVIEMAVVETKGPLAGLMDVLPLNPQLAAIQGPAARLRAEPSQELLARAQSWRSLLDKGLNFWIGERAAEPPLAGIGATLERWLVFALLIGMLILGLYWPLPFFQPTLLLPPEAFLSQLDQAPAGGLALIAVDYGPDRAAELEIYLQRILDRLTARQVRVLTVSLSPWGAAQAAQVVQGRPDYGERVVHLGYYPGHEVGAARLLARPLSQLSADYRGQSLRELPVGQGLGEDPLAAHLGLLVLITGSPDTLRGWIQQARGILRPEVPVVAAIGANLAPLVTPYRESGQLRAVAVGLRDALLLDGTVPEGSPAFFDLQAQAMLQMLVVALMGLGLVIRLLQSLIPRKEGRPKTKASSAISVIR